PPAPSSPKAPGGQPSSRTARSWPIPHSKPYPQPPHLSTARQSLLCYVSSCRCFPLCNQAPRAYRLKASNAAPSFSTFPWTTPAAVRSLGWETFGTDRCPTCVEVKRSLEEDAGFTTIGARMSNRRDAENYLIWSDEHNAWRGLNRKGYTHDPANAERYTR